jgi:hypothetical protein
MLASKFVVDGLCSSFTAAAAGRPWAQWAALFHNTAVRACWLDRPPPLQQFA